MSGIELSRILNTNTVESFGLVIELADPAGKPYRVDGKPVKAKVLGTYSEKFRSAESAANHRLDRFSTPEHRASADRRKYAAAVAEWDITANGTMASPERVFENAQHIYEQIIIAANDHAAHFNAYEDAHGIAHDAPVTLGIGSETASEAVAQAS